jgi:hypothetical protein
MNGETHEAIDLSLHCWDTAMKSVNNGSRLQFLPSIVPNR